MQSCSFPPTHMRAHTPELRRRQSTAHECGQSTYHGPNPNHAALTSLAARRRRHRAEAARAPCDRATERSTRSAPRLLCGGNRSKPCLRASFFQICGHALEPRLRRPEPASHEAVAPIKGPPARGAAPSAVRALVRPHRRALTTAGRRAEQPRGASGRHGGHGAAWRRSLRRHGGAASDPPGA
eukprot:355094-Chlamydomonas_euryale.AAC.3